MFRKKDVPAQQRLWIPTDQIVSTPANPFLARLDQVFHAHDFPIKVRDLCRPYYAEAEEGGRPGIDPVVYFKMLLIGFFENLSSERAIATRCADSLSIRQFLGYDLTEATPDHSSLSVIRNRLETDVFQRVFALVLQALKQHRLVRGKKLGLDSSTLEANASMRTLERRLTGESYQAYIKKLARESGVNPEDAAAVRRFDKKRTNKKVSNQEWHNPNDEDARIGKTKQGPTKMLYKVEHAVDLETGAIVDVDVLPGDQADTEALAERLFEIEERMNQALDNPAEAETIKSLTMDKGYYKVEELARLQESGIKTVVSDPIEHRNLEKLSKRERKAVQAAKRSARAKYGKALTRKRGMYVERSFAHVLDAGGARKTSLRGQMNVKKRYLIQALGSNISLLMRRLWGVGTLKQALAAGVILCMMILQMVHRTGIDVLLKAKPMMNQLKRRFVGGVSIPWRKSAGLSWSPVGLILQAG